MKQRVAAMPEHLRLQFLDSLDADTLNMIARDEWFWEGRPEQMPPDGDWSIWLILAGRGFGKTRTGAEWIVQRTLDFPYDSSGFPAERLIMAYNISDAVASCAEGPSGVLRVLQRMGYEEVTNNRRIDDITNKYTFTKSPKPYVRLLETGAVIHFTGATVDAARSKNLADVWCVAQGEPVLTDRGSIPIEDVLPGDRAWTSRGWRGVLASGCTKRDAKILRITTSAGSVRVTADHRVWANDSWLRADALRPGDIMVTCLDQVNQLPARLLPSTSGTGKTGTTTSEKATTTAAMVSCYTGQSGSITMARSPMDSMSIMSTASAGTARSTISSCSANRSMAGSPGPKEQTQTSLIPPPDPDGRVRDYGACGHSVNPFLLSVHSAGKPSIPPGCEPSCAPMSAERYTAKDSPLTSVLRVELETELCDVYDLTVAGAHEFFAGTGLLKIHNCDEPIKWGNPEETWREGIRPALRADISGDKPRALVTTTPKPIVLLKTWVSDPEKWKVNIVRGSTFDNMINLSRDAVEELRQTYEGTALGRQELYGELLDDITGALFSYLSIHNNRVEIGPERVAHRTVGVDPGLTGDEDGDEMGVVVASRDHQDHCYVLADETTKLAGRDAALHAWRIFEKYHCDTLVYESNLGKAWMHQVFTDAFKELQKAGVFPSEVITPPLVPVFSNQGKKLRAEPVAMRYSQGRVHHIGTFEKLENQMLTFDPLSSKASPDRLDALVHAVRHLISGERKRSRILSPLNRAAPGLGYEPLIKETALGDYRIQ